MEVIIVGAYPHRKECPAYGLRRWAKVDECGPCEYLSRADELTRGD